VCEVPLNLSSGNRGAFCWLDGKLNLLKTAFEFQQVHRWKQPAGPFLTIAEIVTQPKLFWLSLSGDRAPAGREARYETSVQSLVFSTFAQAANDPSCRERGRKRIPLLAM
jgi:hypothetical protein